MSPSIAACRYPVAPACGWCNSAAVTGRKRQGRASLGRAPSSQPIYTALCSRPSGLGDIQEGSDRLEVRRGGLAALHCDFVADLLALIEATKPRRLNRRDVDEYVLATILRHDKPEALGGVEPLHSTDRHSCIHSVSQKPRAATIGPSSIDDAGRQRRNKAGQTLNAH